MEKDGMIGLNDVKSKEQKSPLFIVGDARNEETTSFLHGNQIVVWFLVNAVHDFATFDFRKSVLEERRKSPPFMVGDSRSSGFSLIMVNWC